MKLLAPSILSANFTNLSQQIRLIEMGGADLIHCDIMDGHFVPNLTFGPIVIQSIKKITKLPLDVHLMIKNPDNLLEAFAQAGANNIYVHQEEVVHLNRTINKIKELKCKAGVVINPATPFCLLSEIIEEVDFVLVMSVNPGFGGQSFIKSSLRKISDIANYREKNGLNFLIEVDGGVNKENISSIKDVGCNIFVAGNSIFNTDNITASTAELKQLINK